MKQLGWHLYYFINLLVSGCSALHQRERRLFFNRLDHNACYDPAGIFSKGASSQLPYNYKSWLHPVTNLQYAGFLNQALSDGTIKISG
jgi:hypothetical protein